MCPIPSKVDIMNSTTIATRSIVEFYKTHYIPCACCCVGYNVTLAHAYLHLIGKCFKCDTHGVAALNHSTELVSLGRPYCGCDYPSISEHSACSALKDPNRSMGHHRDIVCMNKMLEELDIIADLAKCSIAP